MSSMVGETKAEALRSRGKGIPELVVPVDSVRAVGGSEAMEVPVRDVGITTDVGTVDVGVSELERPKEMM